VEDEEGHQDFRGEKTYKKGLKSKKGGKPRGLRAGGGRGVN